MHWPDGPATYTSSGITDQNSSVVHLKIHSVCTIVTLSQAQDGAYTKHVALDSAYHSYLCSVAMLQLHTKKCTYEDQVPADFLLSMPAIQLYSYIIMHN